MCVGNKGHVFGLDNSPQQLWTMLRRIAVNTIVLKLIEGNATDIPCANEVFDGLVKSNLNI